MQTLTFDKIMCVLLIACDAVSIVEGSMGFNDVIPIQTSTTLQCVDILQETNQWSC